MQYRLKTSAAIFAFFACHGSAWAEGEGEVSSEDRALTIEEIVVTAQLREQSTQEIPISISALSEEQLRKQGLVDIIGYSESIAGLNFNSIGTGARAGLNITVRGVANSRIADTSAGIAGVTTGFYIDDTAVVSVDPKLFDINRIEVLKGPQGTLFGQSSMGGTVRIIQNQPDSSKFESMVEVTSAFTRSGDPSFSASAMFNMPIIENELALRAVLYHRFDGGYIDWRPPSLSAGAARGCFEFLCDTDENLGDVRELEVEHENANDESTSGGRLLLLYTPSDRLKIKSSIGYQDQKADFNHAFDRNLNQGLVQERYLPDYKFTKFLIADLVVDYEMSFADFKSITSYYERNFDQALDTTTFMFNDFGGTPSGDIVVRSPLKFLFQSEILSQEFRLTSNEHSSLLSGRLDWVVGAAYLDEERLVNDEWLIGRWNDLAATPLVGAEEGLLFATQVPGEYENKSIFGDATFHISDRLSVTAGVRYSEQDSSNGGGATSGPLVGSPTPLPSPIRFTSETAVTPRATISYNVNDDSMVYASASKGFRAGGPSIGPNSGVWSRPGCVDALNQIGLTPENSGAFESDSIWHYEAGVKSTMADGRVRVNASAFYIDWTDLQQNVILANFNPNCTSVVTTNAGSASIPGFELDLTTSPFDRVPFTIHATVGYAKSRLDDPGGALGEPGARIPATSDWTASLSGDVDFEIFGGKSGYFRLGSSYTGSQVGNIVGQDEPFYQIPSHVLVNTNLTFYGDNGWEVSLYGNNLLDETVVLGAQTQFGEGFTNQTAVGRPRTIGLRFNKFFAL